MERRKEAKEKRDMERTTDATDDPKPKGKSPARSTKGGKTPKTKQKSDEPTTSREKDDGNKKESDTRPTKGAKVPKQKGKTRDDDATNRKVADKKQKTTAKDTDERDGTTSRKIGPKTMDKTKHVDDAEYELDLKTGKFVKKTQKRVQRDDDDDDDDIQMEEVDDEDMDEDYDPDKDPDKGVDDDEDDDEQFQDAEADEDDDFEIPPLRNKKVVKTGDDATNRKKQKKSKESDEALRDLADFVDYTFPRESRQEKHKGKKDACINPAEAARFRKAMRDEVLVLERAVRKGKNVSEAYHTMVVHIIQACKDMKYDIPTDIEVDDIFPSIEDPTCKAWQLKLQGIETAGEGELNISKTDNSGVCIAKKKFEIKDVMEYAKEVSNDWTDLKRKNFIASMKKIMGNMTVAHRMVADAAQEMVSLLDEVELPLWIKLADITMRPLVHIEVPEVSIMCEEAKQLSKENEHHWDQTTKVTTIMEAQSLPFLQTSWGYDRPGKAKKVIAGIIYKYVKDRMYNDKVETSAKEASGKFALNSTTMNRHILGKKYEGGKTSTGRPRKPVTQEIAATTRPVEKSQDKATVQAPEDDDDEQDKANQKKNKGSGKSSRITRSAKEIRDESTSEKQKQRAKKRKAEQAELDEELEADPDMPTPKEQRAALAAIAAKGHAKGGVKIAR